MIKVYDTGFTHRITARIKDSKPDFPFRPFVRDAKVYFSMLKRHMLDFTKSLFQLQNFYISSTEEFIDRIVDLEINDSTT